MVPFSHSWMLCIAFFMTITSKGFCISKPTECATITKDTWANVDSHFVSHLVANEMIFMPDYRITCTGRITQWEVEMKGLGTKSLDIVFAVWKPNSAISKDPAVLKYTMIANSSLTITNINGVHTYTLALQHSEYIPVEPGYVIGMYISTPIGPSSGVNTVELHKQTNQYQTWYINGDNLQQDPQLVDIDMASVRIFNQIPMISAKIVALNDQPIESTPSTSLRPPTSSTTNDQSSTIPTPSRSIITSDTATPTSSTVHISIDETVTMVTATPTSEGSNGAAPAILGPIIAIVILVTIIIIGTVVFVILMCYTVQRRLSNTKTGDNTNGDSTSDKRISQMGFPVCRNPSYSTMTLDYKLPTPHRRAVSEHVYETCEDPYEYLDPVNLVPEIAVLSVPSPATTGGGIMDSNRLSSSGIYEIPFGMDLNSIKSAYRAIDKHGCTLSTSVVQPPPVSPGYDVPVCSSDTHASSNTGNREKESLEESTRYKEPGWVYRN